MQSNYNNNHDFGIDSIALATLNKSKTTAENGHQKTNQGFNKSFTIYLFSKLFTISYFIFEGIDGDKTWFQSIL